MNYFAERAGDNSINADNRATCAAL